MLIRLSVHCDSPGVSSGQTFLIGGCMASVTGFGGVFLRADDPKALYQWYEEHLGLVKTKGAYAFPAPANHSQVIFALFKQDNAYFPPAQKAMLNLQVDDLDGVLDRLISEGVSAYPN